MAYKINSVRFEGSILPVPVSGLITQATRRLAVVSGYDYVLGESTFRDDPDVVDVPGDIALGSESTFASTHPEGTVQAVVFNELGQNVVTGLLADQGRKIGRPA